MSRPTLSQRAAVLAAVSVVGIALTATLALYNAGLHRENVALAQFQAAFHRLSVASHYAPEARTEAAFRDVEARVEAVRALLGEVGSAELHDRLDAEIDAFAQAFGVLAQAHRHRGIDEDSGVEGAFRRSAHAIGDAVQARPALRTALLEMRRSEKDYIMRRDPAYIARVRAYADSLRTALEASALPPAERARLSNLTDDYEARFETLAASFAAIETARRDLLAADRDVEAFVSARVDATQRKGSWALAALLAVLGAGIAAAFSVAFFLHRHVLEPLRWLGAAADRLGAGAAPNLAPTAFRETNALRAALERSAYHVAAQRAAEADSRTSARFLRSILGSMTGGLVVTGRDGRILLANPVVAALAEVPAEALVGRRVGDVFPVDSERYSETLRRVFAGESVDLGDRKAVYPGRVVWYSGTATPVTGDDGDVRYAVYTLSDLTERKRYEMELGAARREAESVARLKTALLDNLSHELRTPLSAIIGYSDLLLLEAQGEQHEFACAIRDAGQHQLRLLSDLLDYSQAVAGLPPPPATPYDLCDAARHAVRSLRSDAERKGLELELDLPGEAPILGGAAELRAIATRLVENAVAFTDAGRVVVRAAAGDDRARLIVADTGPGIEPAFRKHLFDEFRQQSAGLRRTHGGLGLGLALARRYAEHLGGTIACQSAVGEGTTFTVELPLAVRAARSLAA